MNRIFLIKFEKKNIWEDRKFIEEHKNKFKKNTHFEQKYWENCTFSQILQLFALCGPYYKNIKVIFFSNLDKKYINCILLYYKLWKYLEIYQKCLKHITHFLFFKNTLMKLCSSNTSRNSTRVFQKENLKLYLSILPGFLYIKNIRSLEGKISLSIFFLQSTFFPKLPLLYAPIGWPHKYLSNIIWFVHKCFETRCFHFVFNMTFYRLRFSTPNSQSSTPSASGKQLFKKSDNSLFANLAW